MPPALKILSAEPPPERREGGIETALGGLAGSLRALGVDVNRSSELTIDAIRAADVVHFHGIWEPTHNRARRWCRQARKPFLVSPHGMLEDWAFRHRGWKKRPYFHLLERPSINRGQVVLATSDDEARTLRQWFASDKIRVLPLGVEPAIIPLHPEARQRLAWPEQEFAVLFLSRCHEKKGLHLLVNAMPEVAAGNACRLHLVIVGDGALNYIEPLRQATTRWTGNLRCTWVGACWSDAKWNYLGAADLLCLPSFSENFGLVVLESLLAGTPVLTTPATPWGSLRGSLPVFLTQPEAGALASALRERVAAPPATEAERAATHRAVANTFAWSILAPRYLDLYRQLACDE